MTSFPSLPTSPGSSTIWTPVVLSILITETAERFAYYGLRGVLVLYFGALDYDEDTSIAFYAYMVSLAYASPIIGALLADVSWGRYNTILRFGILYAIGLVILTAGAFWEGSLYWQRFMTFLGLFFVSVGTGGIKPCVSAFGADQVVANPKRPEDDDSECQQSDDDRVREFFASFYFCINLGAVSSFAVVPILRAHYGFGAAFLAPSICIALAIIVFVSKRKAYRHHVPNRDGEGTIAKTGWLCLWLIRRRFSSSLPSCLSQPLRSPLAQQDQGQVRDAARALQLLPVMATFAMFWMLYDQQGSVWTLQAARMNLHGWQPEQLNLINPVEIMLLIPLFDRCVYPMAQARGWSISPLRRMGCGMVLAAVSFFVSGILESIIQSREAQGQSKISVLWQLPQISILAVGEILLSITGLEWAYSVSPKHMKAFLMGVFLLTTAVGDFLGGVLYSTLFRGVNRATSMHIFAVLMLCNLAGFVCISNKYAEQHDYEEVQELEMKTTPRSLGGSNDADHTI